MVVHLPILTPSFTRTRPRTRTRARPRARTRPRPRTRTRARARSRAVQPGGKLPTLDPSPLQVRVKRVKHI